MKKAARQNSSKPSRLHGEALKGARFCAVFLAIFALFYALPYGFLPWRQMEWSTAWLAAFVLNAFGQGASVSVDSGTVLLSNGLTTAELIPLCTGFLEFVVLSAVIMASEDRPFRKRLEGVAIGGLTVLAVNPLRVAVTFQALASQSISFVEFLHNFLFKASLFLLVFGFYAFWYLKASRSAVKTHE